MKDEKKNDKIVVLGIFPSRIAVENCVERLKSSGFRNSDISALFPTGDQSKEFAHEKSTKAPEGATTGAATGVALGGVLGWLAGVGSLAIPGVGPLIAAGPIMAALAGAAAGGVVGGVTGALVGLGIPEFEAKRYEGRVKNGGILLSVHCDTPVWRDTARNILTDCSAEDVTSTSESSSDTSRDSMRSAHY